jgi:hypothetical protein
MQTYQLQGTIQIYNKQEQYKNTANRKNSKILVTGNNANIPVTGNNTNIQQTGTMQKY